MYYARGLALSEEEGWGGKGIQEIEKGKKENTQKEENYHKQK